MHPTLSAGPVSCFRCGDVVEEGSFGASKTNIFVLLAMPSAGTLVPTAHWLSRFFSCWQIMFRR